MGQTYTKVKPVRETLAAPCRNGRKLRAVPGNALLEFCVTLPIIIFVAGLTFHMSTAMLTKQKTLISARHSLWNSAAHRAWTQMNLDPGWNPAASGGQEGDMPRGTGEGLDQLQNRIEPPILQQADNADAIEYFQRVWGNLPGRHEQHSRTGFSTGAPLWSFLNRTVEGDHYRDSSPWPIWHLNAWKICQENTLLEFRETFHAELDVVQEPFEYTRDLILNNLFDDKVPGMDE